jgi:hypothetical protein
MCLHPYLQELLRDQLGFGGFIVSDLGAITFAATTHNYTATVADAVALAVAAGTDLCLGGEYQQYLPDLVASGAVNMSDVERGLNRSLLTRFQLGMFDPVSAVPYNDVSMANVSSAAHRALARQVALEGAVLLKNEGPILPLSGAAWAGKKIALVGPSANYSTQLVGNYPGCSDGPNDPELDVPLCQLVTILDGLTPRAAAYGFNLTYGAGCDINTNDTAGFPAALEAAAGADLIIAAMGLDTCQVGDPCSEGEANDRLTTIDLPGAQLQLLAALYAAHPATPIIVLLINGGVISSPSMYRAANVKAVLELWYAGEEGGNAAADILFGDYAPAGRLPVTIVEDVGVSSSSSSSRAA